MNKLNLHNYRNSGSKIFSGRDNGIEARKKLNLDKLDKSPGQITISIPKDTWSINSSFFGGLFESSVITLREKGFKEKYIFKFDDGTPLSKELEENILEGIHDSLNEI